MKDTLRHYAVGFWFGLTRAGFMAFGCCIPFAWIDTGSLILCISVALGASFGTAIGLGFVNLSYGLEVADILEAQDWRSKKLRQ